MTSLDSLKIAIIYDRVNKWGGAEKVLLTIHEMFPKAPLFTSVYNPQKAQWAKVFPKVNTSFLQNIPGVKNWHEGFSWLMPLSFESFNFDKYDLVISVTSEAAKGIVTRPNTLHVCYMLTPTRYLWSHYDRYFKNNIFKYITRPVVKYLKTWDKIAAQRPDKIIAISTEVQRRIKKYYKRDSELIFPPVEVANHKPSIINHQKSYYLYVGRLVGYKRVDLLIKVFNKSGKLLVIVGTGNQSRNLKKRANKNISFKKFISEVELKNYYLGAIALIMPQEEDFGIVSVEAQNYGVPVIAYNIGGSTDTVINGKTGILFDKQNEVSLSSAIAKFEKMRFNHNYLLKNAKRFEKEEFKRKLQRSLIRAYFGGRRRNTSLAKIS